MKIDLNLDLSHVIEQAWLGQSRHVKLATPMNRYLDIEVFVTRKCRNITGDISHATRMIRAL
jgi:hypothetical protein